LAKRKIFRESVAEALRLRSQSNTRPPPGRKAALAPKRPARPRKPADPEAERQRLIAEGEKLLQPQEAQQARDAARIEAELAKRQNERRRAAEQQQRERRSGSQRRGAGPAPGRDQALRQDAEARTAEVRARVAELDSVLRCRPAGLERLPPKVERQFAMEEPAGLADAIENLLRRSPVPSGCRERAGARYAAESAQVLIEVDLPALEIVPAVVGYQFVAQRAEVVAQPRKDADRQDLYRRLVARLALRALDEVFSATPA
jgi:restriction system protein